MAKMSRGPWRPYRHRRRYTKSHEPQRAKGILGQWLRAKKLDRELLPHFIAQRWGELVGERIAARTRPTALRDGELTVTVATSAWLNELSMMRDWLLETVGDRVAQLAEQIPGGATPAIDRLRLVVGAIRRPRPTRSAAPPPTPTSPPPPREAPPTALEAELGSLADEGLAAAIGRAWGSWRANEAQMKKMKMKKAKK